jgi:hypothetical protein
MKKNIFFLMALAVTSLTMTSCGDDESEGKSRFTFYPTIELEGDSYMVIDKGSTYQEPGYTSTMNSEDVTSLVTVVGNVDTSKSGVYTLKYITTKNEDGFGATASRTVVVLDPNSTIEGFYLTTADSYRLSQGANVAYGSDYEILIIDNGDGTCSVDDILGGWYCQRAGYGTDYAMAGTIAIADDGTVTCPSNFIPGWGDGLDDFEGTYDAANSTFHIKAVYAAMDFVQTWVKE